MTHNERYVRWFEALNSDDVDLVGGKNASLGEMISVLHDEGVHVPGGFATTAQAYREFIEVNEIEAQMRALLSDWQAGDTSLQETGEAIRRLFRHGSFPDAGAEAIRTAYRELSRRYDRDEVDVAARSSATAEDLPEASFAGQQETFLICRTVAEADRVLDVLADFGLDRGQRDLEVYMMVEIPSNVVLAEQFGNRFDGFSIGTNDLTQLVLGVDRDSEELSFLYDERNEAVKRTVADLIKKAHRTNTKVGICGQAPSDYPEFAAFLVEQGIDSMSLNPDSVIQVKERVAERERD